MTEWDAWIGREERLTDFATESALARFRATIGSPEGEKAPPGFHWCLCCPDTPIDGLAKDGHPEKGDFFPPVPQPRRMWASSEVTLLAPITIGAAIDRVSKITSITEKTGQTGALVFVGVEHNTLADGIEAVREHQTLVYREPSNAPLPLPETGTADLTGWDEVQTIEPDPKLLFRYSALTFNTHRIHYDAPYAQSVEGYPGLVVHGPLTATLLLGLADNILGTDEIGSFWIRAKSPAYVGQPLHLAARQDQGAIALAALGDDGRIVMQASASPR
jgi:3-methylfumaryl-CoA hydratase